MKRIKRMKHVFAATIDQEQFPLRSVLSYHLVLDPEQRRRSRSLAALGRQLAKRILRLASLAEDDYRMNSPVLSPKVLTSSRPSLCMRPSIALAIGVPSGALRCALPRN